MIFILNKDKKPLSPCHESVARKLLKEQNNRINIKIIISPLLFRGIGTIYVNTLDMMQERYGKDGVNNLNEVMYNIGLGQSTEILEMLDLKRDLEGCAYVLLEKKNGRTLEKVECQDLFIRQL